MLNILPPQKKDYLRHALTYQQVRLLCIVVVTISVSVAVVMKTSQIILQRWHISLMNDQSVIGISDADRLVLQQKLTDLTTITTGITTVDAKFHNPISLLTKLFSDIPESVHFTTVDIDYTTGQLIITGIADNRTDLLAIQNKISDNSAFANVELPINDFTLKQSIPFTLNAVIVDAKTTF